MPRCPGWQHTIHHVYAKIRIFHDFLGRANPHQIPRLICREVLQSRFDDFTGFGARLAHAQPANGIAIKPDVNGSFGGFFSKCEVHSPLHDAEESLRPRRPRRPRLGGRAQIANLVPSCAGRAGEGTRPYTIKVPRHFPLMLLKCFLLRSAHLNVICMDARALSGSAGYSVHSSNAIVMSAPRPI